MNVILWKDIIENFWDRTNLQFSKKWEALPTNVKTMFAGVPKADSKLPPTKKLGTKFPSEKKEFSKDFKKAKIVSEPFKKQSLEHVPFKPKPQHMHLQQKIKNDTQCNWFSFQRFICPYLQQRINNTQCNWFS